MIQYGFLCNILKYFFGNKSSLVCEKKSRDNSFMSDIIENLNNLAKKDVENILIPRSEMRCVNIDIELPELISYLKKYLHTRILVYEDSPDNIVGFLHIKDVFKAYNASKAFYLKPLIRKVMYVTDNVSLTKILNNMQKSRKYISVVLDEHSGVRGIVTIGDILEELLGPLKDEHSDFQHESLCQIIDDKTLILNGKVKVHELEELLKIKFDQAEDIDTLGGYMLLQNNITKPIEFSNIVSFKIIKFDGRAVRFVKMILLSKDYNAEFIKHKID